MGPGRTGTLSCENDAAGRHCAGYRRYCESACARDDRRSYCSTNCWRFMIEAPRVKSRSHRGTMHRDGEVHAPRGTVLTCKGWQQEAAMRMLMNNLDPDVAERPEDLVVYGGIGRAARNWESYDAIVRGLKELENDETLLVQSGKPIGKLRTHENAPRVIISNSQLVPKWATWDEFRKLEAKGLIMFGQMTAGSWIYIGSQGIVQGTFETFMACAAKHFGGSLKGR